MSTTFPVSVVQPPSPISLCTVPEQEMAHTQALYRAHYVHAEWLPFPGYRTRHRLLRQLCGIYMTDAAQLPSWWYLDLIPLVARVSSPLATMLELLSSDEFYQGVLNEEHARLLHHWRSTLPAQERGHSPKLSKLLRSLLGGDHDPLYKAYVDRGEKVSASPVPLILSAHPWDVLTMGESACYGSCQALTGDDGKPSSYLSQLPANLLDSGMLVAYIPEEGALEDRWAISRMQARVILRLLRDAQGRWGMLIDRFYGDQGLARSMEAALVSLAAHEGLARWMPPQYYLGWHFRDYRRPNSPQVKVQGPLQCFEQWDAPYLDQTSLSNMFWQRTYARGRTYSQVSMQALYCPPGYLAPAVEDEPLLAQVG